MTAFLDDIETAKELIAEDGELCVWRSYPDATKDVSQPWKVTPAVPADIEDVSIVFLPMKRVNYEQARALTGTEIQIGDAYGLMAQQDFLPSPVDVVIRSDGRVYRIAAIRNLEPDGTDILYTIFFNL